MKRQLPQAFDLPEVLQVGPFQFGNLSLNLHDRSDVSPGEGLPHVKAVNRNAVVMHQVGQSALAVRSYDHEFITALTQRGQGFHREHFDAADVGPKLVRPIQYFHSTCGIRPGKKAADYSFRRCGNSGRETASPPAPRRRRSRDIFNAVTNAERLARLSRVALWR